MAGVSDLLGAQDEVRRRLSAFDTSQFSKATPCSEWSVRDLAEHLYNGSNSAAGLLEPDQQAPKPAAELSDEELVEAIDAAFEHELAAFSAPDALSRSFTHPRAGEMNGERLLGLRTGDYLLHSWDLARASGAEDETLPPHLVEVVYAGLAPMAAMLAQSGAFGSGPSGTLPEDAPLQQRLLDLSGRRP